MFARLRSAWNAFKDARPGTRFRAYHRRRNEDRKHKWQKPLSVLISIIIIAVGMVALPAPGPGMLVVAFGAGLLACEFAAIARLLDWLEIRAWRLGRWASETWNGWSTGVRLVATGVTVVLAAGALVGTYFVMFR